MQRIKQLNAEQQRLVEENHNLIYWFINKMRLSLEDYYGVVAIGLCKAAYSYDSSRGCAFSTHAHWAMLGELTTECITCRRHTVPTLSLEYEYMGNKGKSHVLYGAALGLKCADAYEQANLTEYELRKNLSERQRQVLTGVLMGKTQAEIASAVGKTRPVVGAEVKVIRKKLLDILAV